MEAGTYQPETVPPAAHPERVSLYGGVSGLSMSIPEFQLTQGLTVRETYAHVFAPYMMAFARPQKPNAPHPPPWKAARGGLAFDVTIEIALAQSVRPTGFDRLNTLWWVLALMRLISGAPLRMPVVSDTPFAAVPSSAVEPNLWTIEMPPTQLALAGNPAREISLEHLDWMRAVFSRANLMDEPAFNRAFGTFDSVLWAHSLPSAVTMIWAALETLYRPGRSEITKTLATSIATFLHEPGSERDREFGRVVKLYESRGQAAHNSQVPELEQLLDSFDLARRSFILCLNLGKVPVRDELLIAWKENRPR